MTEPRNPGPPDTTNPPAPPKKKPRTNGKKVSAASQDQTETTEILGYRHPDRRKNNPDVGMVSPDTDPPQPKTQWAYDPHLSPTLQFDPARGRLEKLIDDALASGDQETMQRALQQLKRQANPFLEWTGKAERTSFEVDTVSLHVHERMDPMTVLNAVRRGMSGKRPTAPMQLSLFSEPFQNLPYFDAIDFYRHEKGWANRLVSGDSLLVMNSLLKKEGMGGKVQMIYFDPPYGIRYGSNFQPFVGKRDVQDRKDDDLTREPETIKAFRDTWELGIHSYLTYLRDRLMLARDLLHESGSVFVQISDENLHHVRELLDDVFGAENFVCIITVAKTTSATSTLMASVSDYVVWYARNISSIKYRCIYQMKTVGGAGAGQYTSLQLPSGKRMRASDTANALSKAPPGTRVFRLDNMTSQRPPGDFPVDIGGRSIRPGRGYWKTGEKGMKLLSKAARLALGGNTLSYVRFIDDFPVYPLSNLWNDVFFSSFVETKTYVVQTSAKIIERCILMTTDPGDLVLDPTCGSGTTAFAAEKWGRRWITCDTSRVAITLAKQRILTSSFDYFELQNPHMGLKGGFNPMWGFWSSK